MTSRTQLDRLGTRLREGSVTDDDLRSLDAYRRSFEPLYRGVVDLLRDRVGVRVSGRPSKSTAAILDKLRREHIRLSQIQDIAGCRVVVEGIVEQENRLAEIREQFPGAKVVDRRVHSSSGYRAVHILVSASDRAVEIQLRTQLQHLWAEISEKFSDRFGLDVKYGGGPQQVRELLDKLSEQVKFAEDVTIQYAELHIQVASLEGQRARGALSTDDSAELRDLQKQLVELNRATTEINMNTTNLMRTAHEYVTTRRS